MGRLYFIVGERFGLDRAHTAYLQFIQAHEISYQNPRSLCEWRSGIFEYLDEVYDDTDDLLEDYPFMVLSAKIIFRLDPTSRAYHSVGRNNSTRIIEAAISEYGQLKTSEVLTITNGKGEVEKSLKKFAQTPSLLVLIIHTGTQSVIFAKSRDERTCQFFCTEGSYSIPGTSTK